MSRAFVNEDAGQEAEPRYDLPARDAAHYEEAAAWALLEGANAGNTKSAENATGYRWGDPDLVKHVEVYLAEAEREGQDRVAQLARRFLRASRQT